MQEWIFLEISLLKRKKLTPGKYWIKLRMKIEINKEIESGTDEATVERIAGKWFVTEPPT